MEPACSTAEQLSGDPIQTFVFFDLETTGLPGPGSKPRIVELCMVAVHRNNLLGPCLAHTPRVLDKLTLCVNPLKQINPDGSMITGLYNDNVYWQKDLDDNLVTSIELFLQRHEPPVCMVAHNGHKFDFPLLRSELASIEKSLPHTLLCVDSLLMFYDLDGVRQTDPCRKVLEGKPSRKYEQGVPDNLETLINGNGSPGHDCTIPQATPAKSDIRTLSRQNSGGGDLPNGKLVRDNENHTKLSNPDHANFKQKRQKTFHHARRKLEYISDAGNSDSEDFNKNHKGGSLTQPSGGSDGTSRFDDLFLNAENDTNLKHKVVKQLFRTTSDNTQKTDNNGTPSMDRSDSEASSSDTIPVLGDCEYETLSTLQQMSTFIFDDSSNSSTQAGEACAKANILSSQTTCDSTFDSQRTVAYTVMESTPSGSKPCSLPDSPTVLDKHIESYWDVHHNTAHSVTDLELLNIDLDQYDCRNSQTLIDSLTDSVIAEVEIPSDHELLTENTLKSKSSSPSSQMPSTSAVIHNETNGNLQSRNTHPLSSGMTKVSSSSDSPTPVKQNQSNAIGMPPSHCNVSSPTQGAPSTPKCLSPESKNFRAQMEQKLSMLGSHAPKKDTTKQPPPEATKPRLSYKLGDLHCRILGYSPPLSHNAEDDSMSLLRIFHKVGLSVFHWADTHAVPLSSIDFMYPPSPRKVIPQGVFPHQLP